MRTAIGGKRRNGTLVWSCVALTIGLLTDLEATAGVIYVKADSAPGGDGASWATACGQLEDGLAKANANDSVWVAAGTYYPTEGSNRGASFTLQPGVAVYGGFAGNETDAGQCDPDRHRTVLSGDVGKTGEASDNCYHVVVGADGAALSGFTITGGHADGMGYDGKGGGMINYRRGAQIRPNSPTAVGYSVAVSACVFADNYARDGGAIYNYDRSEPKFTSCVFTHNRAENGGAVLDRVGVKARYEDCQFIANTAWWRGGAVYFDYGARPAMTDCVFRDNETSGHGGALHSVSRASPCGRGFQTIPLKLTLEGSAGCLAGSPSALGLARELPRGLSWCAVAALVMLGNEMQLRAGQPALLLGRRGFWSETDRQWWAVRA